MKSPQEVKKSDGLLLLIRSFVIEGSPLLFLAPRNKKEEVGGFYSVTGNKCPCVYTYIALLLL